MTIRVPMQLKENALLLLLLLVLAVVTYCKVPLHSFLINWDDHVYITKNDAIRGFTLQNLETVFSTYYVGNYAPVQMISYMIDYTLWGNNPFGYFLANIIYHCISGALLYFLLLRFGFWKWGACLGAAIFLVHPVQVESVAWLSQRKNLLAMLFYLLSFHGYLSYRDREGNISAKWYYLWSVVAFSLALLAKSVVVIFPIMLMGYDMLGPQVRKHLTDQKDKIPYIVATAIICVIAMISQESNNGGGRIEYPANALIVLPLSMLPVLVRYLQLVLYPVPSLQSIMYFPPWRNHIDFVVVVSFCVVMLLIAAGVFLYRKKRFCLFWYALFFLGLLPVSQIVPLATMMNDRYLYFPMLGVAGLTAVLADVLRDRIKGKVPERIILAVCLVIVGGLSVASHLRGEVWRNSISLFSDAVAKYPEQTNTWSRLAEGYVAAGDLVLARFYYEKAARFGSLDSDARHNLAKIYLIAGEYDMAKDHIWWLLLRGDQSKANLILLGEYYYRIASYPEASYYLMSYIEEFPGDPHALYLLGRICFISGDTKQTREYYSKAFAVGGTEPELYYASACLELAEGREEQSLAAINSAFERNLTSKILHEDGKCLAEMKVNPRLSQLLRQVVGE